ncbi:MAG: type II secretion system protein N [Pseudomonadota bacterium]
MTPRAGTLLLLGTALAAMASLALAARPLVQRLTAGPAPLAAPQPALLPQPFRADLGPVLAFAPFGSTTAPKAAADTAVPVETQTGLTLLGITLARPATASRAIIAGGDTAVGSYAIGAWVSSGIELAGVKESHVVLRVNGRLETLTFPQTASAEVTSAATGPDLANLIPVTTAPAPPVTLPEADARIATYRAALNRDPYGFLAGLGLDAGPQGYVVQDAAATELVQAGLRPGDVISTLNGQPVGNIDTDMALFDAIVASGRITLTAERAGKTLTMTFPLR